VYVEDSIPSIDLISVDLRGVHRRQRKLEPVFTVGSDRRQDQSYFCAGWINRISVVVENRNGCFPRGPIYCARSHIVVVVVVYIWNRGTGACRSCSTWTDRT
jgi:hypothetical protein